LSWQFDILIPDMRRFFEILIPLFTWSLITLPVWLSPFHPAVAAYFIIVFNVYFFYKSLKTVILATVSYINIDKSRQVNWLAKARKIENFDRIKHFFIIPNYKEGYAKVKKTLENLAEQKYPVKNIYIVLALERSEGQEAVTRFQRLFRNFRHRFGGFYATYHVLKPGEEKGKASNEAYAARFVSQWVKKRKLDPLNILVTSCDADALMDPQYCSYLTTNYLLDQNGRYHFYAAPVVLYNNYWDLNFIIRLQTTISSILRMSMLSDRHSLIQISTYSMSLWLLESVDYWDVDIIPEDWHIFLQAFFKYGIKVRTVPVYLLCTRDGVRGKNLWDSFKSRYEQEKRWAWGVSDDAYIIKKWLTHTHIPFWQRTIRVFKVLEDHFLWPVNWFAITLGATIPVLLNPAFAQTVMGQNLPKVSFGILSACWIFLAVILVIDFRQRPKRQEQISFLRKLMIPFEFVLMPVVTLIFTALPGIDAHTRLMLGKYLEYRVTEKV